MKKLATISRFFLTIGRFFLFTIVFMIPAYIIFPADEETNTLLMPSWYAVFAVLAAVAATKIAKELKKKKRNPVTKYHAPANRADAAKPKSAFFDIDDVKSTGKYLCKIIDDKYGNLRHAIESCLKLETELIEVGFVNGCCEKCAKYRNRIYSITGNDDRFPKFPYDFHYDCGLSVSPFVEGIMDPNFDTPNYIAYSNRPFIDDRSEFDMQGYQKRLQMTSKHYASKQIPVYKPQAKQQKEIDISSFMKDEEIWRREMRGLSPVEDELDKIDNMDGHDFEEWCADLLKRNGFENIKVTPGSNDQGVDVLADKGGVKYAIQCKRYSTDPGNKPVQEVLAGKAIYNCHVGAVMTNRYFTQGGKEAAAKTGVLLWDRDKLIEMMQ